MAQRSISPNARRLRWALLIALALHVLLLARFAPDLLTRLDAATSSTPAPAAEQIVELAPLPVPPKARGMSFSTKLGQVSQQPLPPGFFDKPAPRAAGAMQLSGDLDFSRASGLQIVANIIPSAINLPGLKTLREKPRTPDAKLKPLPALKPLPPPAASNGKTQALPTPAPAEAPEPPQPVIELAAEPVAPLKLPPVEEEEESYDVAASIVRAAEAAEQQARAAHAATVTKAAPDYRAMLPLGAMVSPAPLPLGGNKPAPAPAPTAVEPEPSDSSITTYALSSVAPRPNERAPDPGRVGIARQQFLTQLAGSLKRTNVQMLADALKAGRRTTVQMKFLIDRSGLVLEISAAEPANRALIERAAAVIRAAKLPRVPDAMTQVPVELSFPVEVYQ